MNELLLIGQAWLIGSFLINDDKKGEKFFMIILGTLFLTLFFIGGSA